MAGLALITATGTAGFAWIEGMGALDALYMTVITLSTVGFGEVQPLTPAGQAFTIGLIVLTGGLSLYLIMLIAQMVVEANVRAVLARRNMAKTIEQLRDHTIICGYGRLGRIVAQELQEARRAVVVIERDPALADELEREGLPFVTGSACDDDVLDRAGLTRASVLVAATASDAENVFITLSARERNPDLRIHARGESEASLGRLRTAGADHVVSAYQMGGMRMAQAILNPMVLEFIEVARPRFGGEVDLVELRVSQVEPGETIKGIEYGASRLRVVALKRAGGVRLVPAGDEAIEAEDQLLVIGERAELDDLARRLAGDAPLS
jgi:voltage-gated potassium channel